MDPKNEHNMTSLKLVKGPCSFYLNRLQARNYQNDCVLLFLIISCQLFPLFDLSSAIVLLCQFEFLPQGIN